MPLGETLEIWKFTITNHRNKPAKLSLFSSLEFCLWDAQDDATNFQRNFSTGQVEIVDGVIYHKTEYRERRNHFAYFACSEKLAGFDTQRDTFLGPYRSWDNPAAVERGKSFNSVACGWAPHRFASSKAEFEARRDDGKSSSSSATKKTRRTRNSTRRIRRPSTRRPSSRSSRNISTAKMSTPPSRSCARTGTTCSASIRWTSPDVHTNRMVNIWNAYQCMATFNMSRSASFYESGIGRGLGFRDSNQDLLGFVHMVPSRARERILDLSATQLKTGGAFHQYQPLTKRGNQRDGGPISTMIRTG